jgi:hypothetical protein
MKKVQLIIPSVFLLVFLNGGLYSSSMERKPPTPQCSEGCYVFLKCNFEVEKISGTYAGSIFGMIEDVIHGFLGEGKIEKQFMFDEHCAESLGRDYNARPLDLSCAIERQENDVILAVAIQDHVSKELYLNGAYKSSFFTPNLLVGDFAAGFARECKLDFSSSYVFQTTNSGFSVGDIGTIKLDNVPYHIWDEPTSDFILDLKASQELPKDIFEKYDGFVLRKKIEQYTFLGCSILWMVTTTFGLVTFGDSDMTSPTKEVFLASGAAALVSGLLVLVDMPFGMAGELNQWVSKRK